MEQKKNSMICRSREQNRAVDRGAKGTVQPRKGKAKKIFLPQIKKASLIRELKS
jgi:hypothetical protein